jgi:hypothetical protein
MTTPSSPGGTVTPVEAGPRRVSRRVTVNSPAANIFPFVADPRRHGELDGSGTVGDAVTVSLPLREGSTFRVKMHQYGLPYKITSTVTRYEQDKVLEWRHPGGHSWRWEFAEISPGRTEVTETFDYSTSKAAKVLELMKIPARNAAGIEATLEKLAARFP